MSIQSKNVYVMLNVFDIPIWTFYEHFIIWAFFIFILIVPRNIPPSGIQPLIRPLCYRLYRVWHKSATFEVPTLTCNNFEEAIQQESIDFTDFST